jgi:hypothetical protein
MQYSDADGTGSHLGRCAPCIRVYGFTIQWIASVLPIQKTSCVPADVLESAPDQKVVNGDAGIAGFGGAVDYNLIVRLELLKRNFRFVEAWGTRQVQRARNMHGAILPVTEDEHKLEIFPSVNLSFELRS